MSIESKINEIIAAYPEEGWEERSTVFLHDATRGVPLEKETLYKIAYGRAADLPGDYSGYCDSETLNIKGIIGTHLIQRNVLRYIDQSIEVAIQLAQLLQHQRHLKKRVILHLKLIKLQLQNRAQVLLQTLLNKIRVMKILVLYKIIQSIIQLKRDAYSVKNYLMVLPIE